jgi:PST family polysaccharide transporter
MVVLAWLGFGAMSFAIPYVICAVLEAVLAYLATRDAVWMRPKGFHLWRSHFQHGKWVVFSNFCHLALDQGSFAVLGLMLNDAVLGVYYFAYQMLAQIGVLLSAGFQQILFPIMSRLADQPERQREAMKKSLHAVMMTGSFGCLLLAVLFDPLEKLVWHGKWADATPAIMILGLFFPWRVTFGVTTASVLARGRFKPLAFKTLFEGVGLMGAVAIGAHLDPTPSGIALFAGAWLMISRLTVIFFVLQAMGLNALTVVPAITPSWLMAIGAAASAFFLEQWLNLGGLLERELLDPGASQTVRTVVRNVPRLVVIGATYVMLYTALLRLLMPRQLTQAVGVLPMRARLVLERALRLRSVAA